MSRLALTSVGLACFAAICLVQAAFSYQSLSNPVLVAFEEAIKSSVVSVQPPELRFEEATPEATKESRRTKYEAHVRVYKSEDELYHKISRLSLFEMHQFREAVVEDVLRSIQYKIKATSEDEARDIVLKACEGLANEARSELAEARHLKGAWERREFVERDENLLRADNLINFCKFL